MSNILSKLFYKSFTDFEEPFTPSVLPFLQH